MDSWGYNIGWILPLGVAIFFALGFLATRILTRILFCFGGIDDLGGFGDEDKFKPPRYL